MVTTQYYGTELTQLYLKINIFKKWVTWTCWGTCKSPSESHRFIYTDLWAQMTCFVSSESKSWDKLCDSYFYNFTGTDDILVTSKSLSKSRRCKNPNFQQFCLQQCMTSLHQLLAQLPTVETYQQATKT